MKQNTIDRAFDAVLILGILFLTLIFTQCTPAFASGQNINGDHNHHNTNYDLDYRVNNRYDNSDRRRYDNRNITNNRTTINDDSIHNSADGGTSTSSSSNNVNTQNSSRGHSEAYTEVNTNYSTPPANTAYAPTALTTAPCRVALSGGAQTSMFGVSLGGTVLDEGCDRRMDAILLYQLGDRITALTLLYQKPSIKKAKLLSGKIRRKPVENP